jgi:penicillin G amidase
MAGRRTASGRPLLANDPHLQLEFPGVWYEMHLVAAGLDVIGVTVPGTPFVLLGHNTRIAWGMTNTGADVQDLFIERVDLNRRRYFYQGQWLPVEVTRTDIPVSGGDTQSFEVWRTRNGTIFAEVGADWEFAPDWLSPAHERHGERRAFALRWDSAGGEMAGAFEALNRAASWRDFTSAVERFAAPSQNFVYADVEGNIGYAMSGALPQRSSSVGTMPNDGTTGEGQWMSHIPSSSLPRLFNPERGYITSSNNLIDRQWGGLVTRDWAAPYRATRLQRLMAGASGVDLQAAATWQNDVTGLAAADVLSTVDGALAHAAKSGARVAESVCSNSARGIGRSTIDPSSRSTTSSSMRYGVARSSMRWAIRCFRASTSGRAPSGQPACMRFSTSRPPTGSTTSRRSIAEKREKTFSSSPPPTRRRASRVRSRA